jgi:hypothetical protein
MKNHILQKHLYLENYSWEILPGFPEKTSILNFPPEERPFSEELVVKIMPINGIPWIGNFHGISKDYLSGIFSTPQIDIVSIVVAGKGYMVDVHEPKNFTIVPVLPIVDVYIHLEAQIILFLSFTDIVSYGSIGFLWKARVSCDGIRVTEKSKEYLYGFSWDTVKGSEVPFRINIKTGELFGGACVK